MTLMYTCRVVLYIHKLNEGRNEYILKIIIVSHGKLASGFKDTLNFFNAELDIVAIEQIATETNFEIKLEEAIENSLDRTILVFTDIKGGSVNQIAFRLLKKHSFYLITGINLALILELSFKSSIDDNTIKLAIQQAKEEIVFMNHYLDNGD